MIWKAVAVLVAPDSPAPVSANEKLAPHSGRV
jgi:hypothetical protein